VARTKVHVIEVVEDSELRSKQAKANQAVKRLFPNAGPLRLYRTAQGRIGVQLRLTLTAGDRQRLDEAYRAIMNVLGEKRGRPRGQRKIQTKLVLPEAAYRALKRAAAASHSTMSGLVAELAAGLEKQGR
jgi:hypothetical protein